MDEREFWGRELPVGMDNGQPDETRACTRTEDTDILNGPRVPLGGNLGLGTAPLPDTNPKTQFGIKKVPTLSRIPATAILAEGVVMALGASKYGAFNWRDNSVAASVYIDAAMRHLMQWNAGEDTDPESGASHLAHVRACMGILIDAMETGNLVDDRPKHSATLDMMKRFTKND